MYAALNEKNILINAQDCENRENYFCPKCKQPVKLVEGAARAFFKHENQRTNDINEHEYHKNGKRLLVEALQQVQTANVRTEHYLKQIDQRPDILIGDHLAIEYQCAKISVSKLACRVKNYFQANINSIWILGRDYLSSSLTKQHLKFVNYQPNWGFYILMFDPLKKVLVIFYWIRFLGPFNKLTYSKRIFPIEDLAELKNFKPKQPEIQTLTISSHQLQKIQRINNMKVNSFKLQYLKLHQQGVEQRLKNEKFSTIKPIFQTHQWMIRCGVKPKYIRQPLLYKKRS